MMKQTLHLAVLALLLLAGFAQTASADVIVYAGYLNNITGQPSAANTPTPFNSSGTTTLISSGNVTSPHDTGVIRFQNIGSSAVTIDPGLKVQTQGATFQIWDGSLPFVLAPGNDLVL